MADRVKYFMLGLLFLVVAGVIAYDRWNAAPTEVADQSDDTGWEVFVGTQTQSPQPKAKAKELSVPSTPEEKTTKPATPKPKPPVQEPLPKPAVEIKPPAPKVHIIKAGETLESIALHYYKTRKGIQWIVDANKLKNPDRVYENQKLVIPARKVIQGKTKPRATTSTSQIPADGRYRVKSGDGDLYAICRRFYGAKGEGARVARIMELNHLWSAEVKTGTVLILPKK
ncbi:MAG: LysM peptidoglycan-binding domain-containing protein [Planctomycetota bacterium]|jgi:nucleoid-associated protein YgaU